MHKNKKMNQLVSLKKVKADWYKNKIIKIRVLYMIGKCFEGPLIRWNRSPLFFRIGTILLLWRWFMLIIEL